MKQRIIRILIMEGDPQWLEETMKRRGVKGSVVLPNGNIIREAIVGDFLETIIPEKADEPRDL